MDNGSIRVLSRAFSILNCLAKERAPLGVTEIASAVDLPKATVYRLLDSLEGERAVLGKGGRYEIGPLSLLLADAYRSQVGFADAARSALTTLRNETKETVHLFVYERGELYYLDKLESPFQVRMHSRVGGRASLFRLSAGKALLAALSPEELDGLPDPLPDEVAAEFPDIRTRGYALDDEQNEAGLRCVGAAILDEKGRPRGAVSVSAPVYRFPPEKVEAYGLLVMKAARSIREGVASLETGSHAGGNQAG